MNHSARFTQLPTLFLSHNHDAEASKAGVANEAIIAFPHNQLQTAFMKQDHSAALSQCLLDYIVFIRELTVKRVGSQTRSLKPERTAL